MSFKQNDTSIHLGNYEEFFVLYMDKELSVAQMQMVDDFLLAHPDLRHEFDILMSTKLPMETYTFNKEVLMAENMHPGSVAEDLLLYLDDELQADKKNIVEFELAANQDYQQQFEILLKTKLDPSDTITYPDKEELYRSTRRVIPVRGWMKIAATVVVMALAGIVYMVRNDNSGNENVITPENDVVKLDKKTTVNGQRPTEQKSGNENENITAPENSDENNLRNVSAPDNKEIAAQTKKQPLKQPINQANRDNDQQNDLIAVNIPAGNTDAVVPDVPVRVRNNDAIVSRPARQGVASRYNPEQSSVTVNNSPVTSLLTDRNISDVASNDKKGSVKGFLRKATRLIEKRTGFDPINENGELLIGMVAVKLK